MRRYAAALLLLGLLSSSGCHKNSPLPEDGQAVALIQRLGGRVEVDEGRPDRPVVEVDLEFRDVTDADRVCLQELSELQTLRLGAKGGSDAGLRHLRPLSQLRHLQLLRPEG